MTITASDWRILLTRRWVQLGLFVIAGLLVYAPSLNGELLWDDEYLVGQNPFYKSPVFALEVFRHYLFFDSFSTYYRPVQNLSYIWDYWIFAGTPFGYHFTNILLHAGSAWLLFRLLGRILPGLQGSAKSSEITALLVATVWLVHPIHNAAVAYISGRADSLASLFALSGWLLYLRGPEVLRNWRRRLLFGLAALAALLALCSKEIALIWLVLFIVHLFAFQKGITRHARFAVLGSLTVVFTGYYLLHELPGYRTPMENGPAASWPTRFLLMLRALGDYSSLIFFPSRLMMDRVLTSAAAYTSSSSWLGTLRLEYLSLVGAAAGLLALVFCRHRGRGQALRVFGLVWFGVAFLPISNLFPLNAQVAEHWIYLASIGYLLFLVGCVGLLSPKGRTLAACVTVAFIAALGVRTAFRAADWSSAETFFTRTIEDGGGTPRIFGNLAAVYAKRGDFKGQEALLRRTLDLFPTFATARINLGICLSKQGRTEEAEAFLKVPPQAASAMSTQFPRTWSAALNLAALRAQAGRMEEALSLVAEARRRFPEVWELVKYEAELRRAGGGNGEATGLVEEFAAAHWWHEDSWMMLAQLRAEGGDRLGATAALGHASRLDIHDPAAFSALAWLEAEGNRPEAAVEAQRSAIRRAPEQPSGYLALASFLTQLGRTGEAAEATRRADALRESAAVPAS